MIIIHALLFLMAAMAGTDYTTTTVDRTFLSTDPVGTDMCITVPITGTQDLVEGDETFFVTLTSMVSGIQLGQTIVTIEDAEGMKVYL